MNEKDIMTEAEEWRCHQSTMLSKFEEIAKTFLNSVNGEKESNEVFASLQDYLDGAVLVDGAYSRRRTVVLTIHDMAEELEAPIALQDKTLEKLEFLSLRPVPRVRFYQDVATAILRMEVVIRLKAATQIPGEALAQRTPEPAEAWTQEPVEPQAGNIKQMPWEDWAFGPDIPQRGRWPLSKLATIGSGMAVAACLAGAFVVFGHGLEIKAHPTRDLTISAETAADTQADAQPKAPVPATETVTSPATASSAPETVTPPAVSEAVPSVIEATQPAASPQEPAKSSPWAASVEADFKSAELGLHP